MIQIKRINGFLLTLVVLITIISACARKQQNETRVIVTPYVTYPRTNTLSITSLELRDSLTLLNIKATYTPGTAISISSSCKLITDRGTEMPLLYSDNIIPDSMFLIPDSGVADFTLYYDAMPITTKYFNFIECSGSTCFNLYGVYLNSRGPQQEIPEQWAYISYKDTLSQEDLDTLPTSVYSSEPALLCGHIQSYLPDMDIALSIRYTPYNEEPIDTPIVIGKDGNFMVSAHPYYPVMAKLYVENRSYPVVLVPGISDSILINISEFSSPGYIPDFKGNLAKTQYDYAGFSAKDFEFDDLIDFEDLKGKSADKVVSYLNDRLKESYEIIEDQNVNKTCKEIIRMNFEADYLDTRLSYHDYQMGMDIQSFSLDADIETMMSFLNDYAIQSNTFMDTLKSRVPQLSCFNSQSFTLTDNIFNLYDRYRESLPDITNSTNREALLAYSIMKKFNNGSMLSQIEMSAVDSFRQTELKNIVKKRLSGRIEMIDSLRKNRHIHIMELDSILPSKVMDEIISHYKDRAICVNIWSTWIPECSETIDSMVWIKKKMENRNIAYIYITSSTSPLEQWSRMIPNIEGEHYYLTESQYTAILKKYNITDVPGFIIFNRKGKKTYSHTGFPGQKNLRYRIEEAFSIKN